MEPVEINAGRFYLRMLRADDLMDDRPAVFAGLGDPVSRTFLSFLNVTSIETAGEYIARRAAMWAAGTCCSWGVAEPTTGGLLGEVLIKEIDLDRGLGEAGCWTHPDARGRGIAVEAIAAVTRYGFGALGLREIRYKHDTDNVASARVAEKTGFTRTDEGDADEVVWIVRDRGTN